MSENLAKYRKYENELSDTVNYIVTSHDFGIKNSKAVKTIFEFEPSLEKSVVIKLIGILGRLEVYSRVTNKLDYHTDIGVVFENFAILASARLKTIWLMTDQEFNLAKQSAELQNNQMTLEEISNRICGWATTLVKP